MSERDATAPAGGGAGRLALGLIALTGARLTLTCGHTITALGQALHDEGVFLRLARALLAGEWLGPYDQLTLVKGPFYPAWIAIVHALGLPLLLAEQALYVAACVTFAFALRPLLPRAATVALYCLLLFNPASYADQVATRVSREAVYPALTLLVAGCAIGFLVRRDRSVPSRARWAVGLGLALAAFWLTREEGSWLVPSVLVLLGPALIAGSSPRPACRWRLSLCALPFAIWLLSIVALATFNLSRYGVFATVELKSGDFLAAYGSLTRVGPAAEDPRVPVPREVRRHIYAVSPAFAELRPFLEGGLGRAWAGASCTALSVCSDIGGGWFLWALRDAAAAAGHHRSGDAAARYYRTLATEVDSACARGALTCGPERRTLMPSWRSEYARPFLRTVLRASVVLVRFAGASPFPSASMGPVDSLRPFRELTYDRLTPRYVVRGWVVSPGVATTLSLRRSDGERSLFHVSHLPSPDVYRRFATAGLDVPEAAQSRFEITTTCRGPCELIVSSPQGILRRIPLDGTVKSVATPALYLDLESVGYEAPPVPSKVDSMMIAVLGGISLLYGALAPPLLVGALAAYAASTLRAWRGRAPTLAWWVGAALLLAVAVRLVVLSLIHVTSFPTVGIGHLAPVHPLLLAFIVVTLAADPNVRRIVGGTYLLHRSAGHRSTTATASGSATDDDLSLAADSAGGTTSDLLEVAGDVDDHVDCAGGSIDLREDRQVIRRGRAVRPQRNERPVSDGQLARGEVDRGHDGPRDSGGE